MADSIEKWTLEDGRRAEKHVIDNGNEKIIELHVEDSRPVKLQQRIVEKSKPIVYEREIQTLDAEGNIIEKKIESIEPRVSLQLVEHIGLKSPEVEVVAQSVEKPFLKKSVKNVNGIKSFGIAEQLAARDALGSAKDNNLVDNLMQGAIVVVAAVIVYMWFFM